MKIIKPSKLWNLDETLARIILPYLIAFRKMKRSGYPVYREVKSLKDWNKVLDKMILAFNLMVNDDFPYKNYWKKAKIIDEGLKLFGRYFRALWD